VNTDFFEDYLGMRCEGVDEVEIIRRMTEGIYDKEEFEKALAWAKANCKEGEDVCNRKDLHIRCLFKL
jgi:L-fucose isomerase